MVHSNTTAMDPYNLVMFVDESFVLQILAPRKGKLGLGTAFHLSTLRTTEQFMSQHDTDRIQGQHTFMGLVSQAAT